MLRRQGTGRRAVMGRQPVRLSVLVALTLGVALAIPSPSIAQTVSFMARQDYAAGRDPSSVAVGDFNGDGTMDLAVVNRNSGTVSLLLGNGDGTFQAAQSVAVGDAVVSAVSFVAVGDFNRDGKLDLVVVNGHSHPGGTCSGLLGNADRTVQSAQTV